jgi:hypothetical protein
MQVLEAGPRLSPALGPALLGAFTAVRRAFLAVLTDFSTTLSRVLSMGAVRE